MGWWFDECLIVVPRQDWPSLIERAFGDMNPLLDDQRELSRLVLAGAYEQELDRQGRVSIAPELRAHAGIEGRAKVVGVGAYLEVWNPERLAERFEALRRGGVYAHAKRLADRIA